MVSIHLWGVCCTYPIALGHSLPFFLCIFNGGEKLPSFFVPLEASSPAEVSVRPGAPPWTGVSSPAPLWVWTMFRVYQAGSSTLDWRVLTSTSLGVNARIRGRLGCVVFVYMDLEEDLCLVFECVCVCMCRDASIIASESNH